MLQGRWIRLRLKWVLASSLEGLGEIALAERQAAWAVQLIAAADAVRAVHGDYSPIGIEQPFYDRMLATARAQVGEKAFVVLWAEGRAMTPEQALAAQNQPVNADRTPAKPGAKAREATHRGRSPAYPQGLTEREGEVLRLVAHGLTDAQIAETLVISPRTVNAHLRSIYTKLDITSRNAATYFALEHDLI